MIRLKYSQKGFTTVEGLLIVILLVMIGGIGYMVYYNNHKTKAVDNNPKTLNNNKNTVHPIKSNTPSPYVGWNTYTLPKEGLTFRYPTTWTVENNNFNNGNNAGIQFTSKTDSSFEILIGAGQNVAAVDNYDGNCVQEADPVSFVGQTAYLDLVGFANINTAPPSCSPASSTIQSILLSKSNTAANVYSFFLTKNIPQPTAPSASEIIVHIDYSAPNGKGTNNKTLSEIENGINYKDAKLVVESMMY